MALEPGFSVPDLRTRRFLFRVVYDAKHQHGFVRRMRSNTDRWEADPDNIAWPLFEKHLRCEPWDFHHTETPFASWYDSWARAVHYARQLTRNPPLPSPTPPLPPRSSSVPTPSLSFSVTTPDSSSRHRRRRRHSSFFFSQPCRGIRTRRQWRRRASLQGSVEAFLHGASPKAGSEWQERCKSSSNGGDEDDTARPRYEGVKILVVWAKGLRQWDGQRLAEELSFRDGPEEQTMLMGPHVGELLTCGSEYAERGRLITHFDWDGPIVEAEGCIEGEGRIMVPKNTLDVLAGEGAGGEEGAGEDDGDRDGGWGGPVSHERLHEAVERRTYLERPGTSNVRVVKELMEVMSPRIAYDSPGRGEERSRSRTPVGRCLSLRRISSSCSVSSHRLRRAARNLKLSDA